MRRMIIDISDENYKKIMKEINRVGAVKVNEIFSDFVNKAMDLYFSEKDDKSKERSNPEVTAQELCEIRRTTNLENR